MSMKNRATIRMSAGLFTVSVNLGKGKTQLFDLNAPPFSSKDGHRKFIVQFVRSYRDAQVAQAA